MGNRAIITTRKRDIGLYLHWNGGRDSVEAFLRYCELRGFRCPEQDDYWLGGDQVMDDDEVMDQLCRAIGFDYRDRENWLVLENGEKDLTPAYLRRLADFIEPAQDHFVEPDEKVDRDELLEEVKELEKCAYYFGLDFDEDEPLRDRLKEASEAFAESARCIREALGESDG